MPVDLMAGDFLSFNVVRPCLMFHNLGPKLGAGVSESRRVEITGPMTVVCIGIDQELTGSTR